MGHGGEVRGHQAGLMSATASRYSVTFVRRTSLGDGPFRSTPAASRPGLVAQIQLQGETRAPCANISLLPWREAAVLPFTSSQGGTVREAQARKLLYGGTSKERSRHPCWFGGVKRTHKTARIILITAFQLRCGCFSRLKQECLIRGRCQCGGGAWIGWDDPVSEDDGSGRPDFGAFLGAKTGAGED